MGITVFIITLPPFNDVIQFSHFSLQTRESKAIVLSFPSRLTHLSPDRNYFRLFLAYFLA